jgi:purine-binding chemotaxis protein CheW
VALLVDKVSEILYVSNNELLPVAEQDSFNGCVTATVTVAGNAIHLLSPARILLAKERESIAAFRTLESVRLEEWKLSLR